MANQINVFIDHPFEPEIRYTLSLMEDVLECTFNFFKTESAGCLIINNSDNSSIPVSIENFQKLVSGKTQWKYHFSGEGPVTINGKPDYIFSVFYIINSFQEYNLPQYDMYNRVRTEDTWQYRFDLIKKDICIGWIKDFCKRYLNAFGVKTKDFKTLIFLSHDIDLVYQSVLQDSYYSLRKLRFGDMLKIFADNVLGKPGWFNMDRIMQIENMNEFRSTFFWLVTKKTGRHNVANADYNICSKKLLAALEKVSVAGWTNGLHKSSMDYSFEEELKTLPVKTFSNRYHFLFYALPDGYKKIADAGLKLDGSLGFADSMGFRNSYATPFKPYNLSTRKSYGFVECPLNIMDTTYHFYNKLGATKLAEDSIALIEKNNTNAVISVLFHNTYISEYKFGEYLKAYKKLLSYFYESGLKSISPEEITKTFLREY